MPDPVPPGDELQINAFDGAGTVAGAPDPNWARWGTRRRVTRPEAFLAPGAGADARDWQDARVGWGIVLAENEALDPRAKAAGEDAPDPIRDLLADRPGSPVFRWRAEGWTGSYLRRYYDDGSQQDVRITGGETGTGRGQMPRYLLIVGSPREIPWEVQFRLNVSVCVGRLDLPPQGLRNYVSALRGGWAGSAARRDVPVVWGVDHGNPDITWLMRRALAERVADKYATDAESTGRVRRLTGDQATVQALTDALAAAPPSLVVSTSHGMTGPVDDPAAMARDLGVLVDQYRQLLQPAELLARWQPDGAIWYAHACCSAGGDAVTRFRGLVDEASQVGRVLNAVAGLGALTAPFPTALLGAERPLRAFVGHVEPTFNWTLRDPDTGQVLTAALINALYERLFDARPMPIGLALETAFDKVAQMFAQWAVALEKVNEGDAAARAAATLAQLTALDGQSMVILGDPTVALRPPAP